MIALPLHNSSTLLFFLPVSYMTRFVLFFILSRSSHQNAVYDFGIGIGKHLIVLRLRNSYTSSKQFTLDECVLFSHCSSVQLSFMPAVKTSVVFRHVLLSIATLSMYSFIPAFISLFLCWFNRCIRYSPVYFYIILCCNTRRSKYIFWVNSENWNWKQKTKTNRGTWE